MHPSFWQTGHIRYFSAICYKGNKLYNLLNTSSVLSFLITSLQTKPLLKRCLVYKKGVESRIRL